MIQCMNKYFLNRRQFGARCAALGLSFPAASAIAVQARAQVPDAGAEPPPAPRTVKFPNGTIVPALGQGSWHLGQGRHRLALEEEAMRTGIALGMTVIDTSRNYGEGRSESFVGRAIAGQRDRVFLISKIQADEIMAGNFARAFQGSLSRLGTDYLDICYMHRDYEEDSLEEPLRAFDDLIRAGKLRYWGLSNFRGWRIAEAVRLSGQTGMRQCARL